MEAQLLAHCAGTSSRSSRLRRAPRPVAVPLMGRALFVPQGSNTGSRSVLQRARLLPAVLRSAHGRARRHISAHRARPRRAEHGVHPAPPANVIHHSDQGCQYTSIAFGQRCREMAFARRRARSAMPTVTPCARVSSRRSNASCSIDSGSRTRSKRGLAVFDFIEGWYNPHRRHSALAYESPINYERKQLSEPKCEKRPPVHGTG